MRRLVFLKFFAALSMMMMLISCSGGGSDSTALPSLNANFTYVANYLEVTFTDTSTAPSGNTITARSWDFGDNNVSTETNPVHTYANAGTYTVKLTVTDVAGTPYTVSKDVNILIFDLVVKSMEGYLVTFEDKTVYPAETTPKKWTWEFGGDGSEETPVNNVEFLYQTNSVNKKVTLTVTDDNGNTYSATKDIRINFFVHVYAGKDFTIAKDSDNNLYGWGKNTYGQLGIGSTEDTLVPVKIPFPNDTQFWFAKEEIHIRDGFVLIRTLDGKLYGWGRNDKGQLGLGDFNNRHTIQEIPMPAGVAGYHNFLVGDDFAIGNCSSDVSPTCYYIWGANDKGQIGDGTNIDVHTPKLIAFPANVTKLNYPLVGPASAYFSTEDSSGGANFLVWGDNTNGILGTGDRDNKNTPTPLSTALGSVSVRFANANFVAAAHSPTQSKAYSWGKNNKGQLGIGSTTDQLIPTEILNRQFHAVYGMENTVLAVQQDNSYKVWGDNSKGQLGIGSTSQYESSPQDLSEVTYDGSDTITAGLNHILIWDQSTTKLYIWGSNEKGQIGLPGVGASLNTATHINTEKLGDKFYSGAAKGNHTFVISLKTFGLYATGANESGQLGTGDTTDKTEFTPVKFIP